MVTPNVPAAAARSISRAVVGGRQPIRQRGVIVEGDRAWHVVAEDVPFKKMAEDLQMDPRELLGMNVGRPELKGLQISSEVLAGTKLQVRDVEYDVEDYCHWSFPEDDPALASPSYMVRQSRSSLELTGPVAGEASRPATTSTWT